MIIGKRHLILAALVIALGAAVYLNWQFAPTEEMIDPSGSTLMADSLIDAEYAATTPVSSSADAAAMDEEAVEAGRRQNSFEKARKDRDDTRREALSTLREIIDDPALDNSQKTEAVNKSAAIAAAMEKEAAIETLLKAKGYSDCAVVISDAEVNIIVPTGGEALTSSGAAVIRDLVIGQIDVMPGSIKIIEVK